MSKISYISDISLWEQEFSYFYPVKVRFSEVDMYGHLNNTVPFLYFQEARINFFMSNGLMNDWLNDHSDLIIVAADLQCDFLKQVFFDEDLKIYVKANEIGRSSVDIHYMGKNSKNEICFVGRGALVQISKKTGKAVPWSDDVKKILAGESSKTLN